MPARRSTAVPCVLLLLSAAVWPAAAQDSARSPVLAAMRQELTRSIENLKTQPTPPSFLRPRACLA